MASRRAREAWRGEARGLAADRRLLVALGVASGRARRGRCAVCAGLALVATLGTAAAASAQEDELASLLDEGIALRAAGDPQGAVQALERALATDPSPRVSYQLALALAESGLVADARRLLERLLETTDDLLVADAARELLPELAARTSTLAVRIEGERAGCRLIVDGRPAPLAGDAAELSLDPGEHEIAIERDARVVARAVVALDPGERGEVELRAPPALDPARVLARRIVSAEARAADRVAASLRASAARAPAPRDGDGDGDESVWIAVGIGGGVVAVAAIALGAALAAQ